MRRKQDEQGMIAGVEAVGSEVCMCSENRERSGVALMNRNE